MTKKILLIGMPGWSVEHPYYSLAYVGGIVRKAGWFPILADVNIELYQFVEDDDRKYWAFGDPSLWLTRERVLGSLSRNMRTSLSRFLRTFTTDPPLISLLSPSIAATGISLVEQCSSCGR